MVDLHNRALISNPSLGVEWHRLDLGRRASVLPCRRQASEPWDHFLRVASAERATIEMMEDVPQNLSLEHVDTIFEGLTTLRPRLRTGLLEGCKSIRAKRLFLFFADRLHHGWAKHIDRQHVDLARGKRQLVPGGQLDRHYQITVPATFTAKAVE